ncbi:class I SAM-dependent methyltransferase [Mycolicibacterium holsaticum]|uniref:S-adenosyl-L-methionine-dependent methyltransferase n=1 Tax=Mycolicibacterium holsaticum TaxID=152142 RepID=A0A1E3RUP2_9MYCO|nr:class I SAM-dependent methyltransferase [Mycolicibacterium holsaticum]MDA4109247.1 S-adenosyl-L-methionine-dependent methyltransferase [Mycolicibacterium holsaticum DSM 44478 = JCM 12374]ODQ93558.1 SAM-dependent methyltransferase [Mycolicibacterium holsaticum]QZA11641.1 class I SAM-dependent methyltransferase [Mycolicibacterium holsaticum DSM 44478 = JCM 12374]UNC10871.1 class I SAM-dependent methyltransferase [Mycolicibacterium holsaticum DSM 44478 = JCM 12374]
MRRTDNDTWDLASSVGATATSVAAQRALASRAPDPLIEDPYADALVKAVGLEHCIRIADGDLPVDDPLLDRQRMCEQIAVRTRYFDDFFLSAASAGIRQAVILAAGLDTRAYRLPWPSDTVVFEVDQPQVIEFKSTVLEWLGAALPAERRTVAVDLRDDWPSALRDKGFDTEAPTAWIAEGLLIYLPPEAQDRLFDHITALSAPGSRLATEHMDIAGLSDKWAQKLSERSRRMGSPINLTDLFYAGERNSARDYLGSKGWRVDVRTARDAFAHNGFQLPDDDLLALVGDSGYLCAILD